MASEQRDRCPIPARIIDLTVVCTEVSSAEDGAANFRPAFRMSKARDAPDLVHGIDVVVHAESPAVVPPALLRAPLGQRAQRLGDRHRLEGRDFKSFYLMTGT
jgi:hypothetical protein